MEEKIALADRKNGYYLDMVSTIDESEILPGIPAFLERLRAEGYKIALGSASKSGGMILKKLGLMPFFDAVVDGNLVERAKPDPQVFTKAAEMLEQVNSAISAVLAGGQSYKIGSRSLTRADLAQLKAIRDDLEAQIDSGTDNCLLDRTFVAFFDGR